MTSIHEEAAAILSGCAQRSRFIFPADGLQIAAEVIFIGAGEIENELQPYQVRLFHDLLCIAEGRGFRDADILRSLIQHRSNAWLKLDLVREVIEIFGGAGDFLDAIDLITWPDAEAVQ